MNKDNPPERDNPLVAVTLRFKDGEIELEARRCRVCGCTETTPCIAQFGPCYWVEWDLCSACAGRRG